MVDPVIWWIFIESQSPFIVGQGEVRLVSGGASDPPPRFIYVNHDWAIWKGNIYLEPNVTSIFEGKKPPKQGRTSNQNRGHLGSR